MFTAVYGRRFAVMACAAAVVSLGAVSAVSAQGGAGDIEMVFVEGGTFTMEDVKGGRSVTVSDFSIGKYEVTQKLWVEIMGSNPSKNQGKKLPDNLPVERVSWNDVQMFIQELNVRTGKNYRLPTEEEWEYAARGGNKSKGYQYSGSNDVNEVAWWLKHKKRRGPTSSVGSLQANELGIYDMSGNVSEWTSDDHKDSNGSKVLGRVFRGGSWFDDEFTQRVARRLRLWRSEDDRSDKIGFRLVLTR